jgi:BirA family biotin operon repressor/biotin-[acetyl-CoA-carboxylase] ligase
MPPAPSALTLALGVAAARALESLGVDRVDLKWPNDLVWRDRKLGGVLVETTSAGGRFVVVAGIGVNVRLPQGFDLGDGGPAWSRGVADVAAAGAGACIADVAAAMIPAFAAALAAFAEAGFAPLAAAYNRRNWLGGRDALIDGERVRCAGVAADGRLVTSRGPVSSGEVIPVDIIEARA